MSIRTSLSITFFAVAVASTVSAAAQSTPSSTGPAKQVAFVVPNGPSSPSTGGPAGLERQDAVQRKDETLLSRRVEHGGYGAPELKLTEMRGNATLLLGAQGGWIIDHRFVIGAAAYATAIDTPADMAIASGDRSLGIMYGGVRAAYVFLPHDVLHFGFGLLLGGGGLTTMDHHDADRRTDREQDAFFALEPSFELEANVSRLVRVALAGSYRYLGGVDGAGLTTSNLSGPAIGTAVKIGVF